MKKRRIIGIAAIAAVLLAAAGYLTVTSRAKIDAAVAPPPAEMEVATVQQQDLPIEREWVGTLDGMVNAAIKAQVSGYLLRQDYADGSFVRTGQLLFEIDPRPFQTAVDQAAGQLAQARAQVSQAQAGLIQAQAVDHARGKKSQILEKAPHGANRKRRLTSEGDEPPPDPPGPRELWGG